ncbi:MAG: thioredoxin [Thermodesulfobacteriota bacterium]
MSDNINDVSDDNFEDEILKSDVPALIDFWATWCAPCKAIAPIVEEMAAKYDGKLKVAKMNVDDNQLTPVKYGVRSIPTLILFKNGEVADQVIGAVSKSHIEDFIDRALET